MTPELQTAAEAIVVALVHIEQAAGAEASAEAAEIMIRLATIHLFNCIGPQAAKAVLISMFADLEIAIASQNGGSTALS